MIETERLTLRALSRADLPAFVEFLGDARATEHLHTPDPQTDPDAVSRLLDRWVEQAEMYTLVVRATGATAGFVGFVPRELEWGKELELGWLLLPSHWGNGYATEAARALRPLKPQRIVSLIRTDNTASENVARKLGSRKEREITYHGYRTGVWANPAKTT
jgi:RimJ/RimL family protein N-acetyltransferase